VVSAEEDFPAVDTLKEPSLDVEESFVTYFPRIGVKHFLDLTGVDLKTAA
jgi:hypothetical protein